MSFIAAKLEGATHSRSSSRPVAATPPDVNLKVAPPPSSGPAEATKFEETEQKDLMGLLGGLCLEPEAKRQRTIATVESSDAEDPGEHTAACSNDEVEAAQSKGDPTSKGGNDDGDSDDVVAPSLDCGGEREEAKVEEEGQPATDTSVHNKHSGNPEPAAPAEPAVPAEPALETRAEELSATAVDPNIPEEFYVVKAALTEELAKLKDAIALEDSPCSSWEDARRLGLSGKAGRVENDDEQFTVEIQKRTVTEKWDTAAVCLKVSKNGAPRMQLLSLSFKVTGGEGDDAMRKTVCACRALVATAKVLAQHSEQAGKLFLGVSASEDGEVYTVTNLKAVVLSWLDAL